MMNPRLFLKGFPVVIIGVLVPPLTDFILPPFDAFFVDVIILILSVIPFGFFFRFVFLFFRFDMSDVRRSDTGSSVHTLGFLHGDTVASSGQFIEASTGRQIL